MRKWYVVMLWGILAVGCGESEPEQTDIDEGRCRPPAGVSGAPQTIDGVIDLMNSLPKPVTVPCFVESLDRPMTVLGSSDVFSAQPAGGENAPRIFAVYDQMIMSFVPDGKGSTVLEFAEERGVNMSVKGEIVMPVEDEITADAAFEHIKFGEDGTVCGSCHQQEAQASDITYGDAYESLALRPARTEIVRLEDMQFQHEICDPELTPRRCQIYDALFYRGEVEDGDFPRLLPTIYD